MLKDYLKLHFIIFIWGFTAILGKLITLPSIELVFYRTGIAVLALAAILFWKRKIPVIKFNEIWPLLLTGSIIAAHWVLFFLSARVSNVSVCLAGMATVTLWTAFLEPLFFKRRISGLEVFCGLLVIFGLYIIFRFEFDQALGLFIALASAFLAALFSIINAMLVKKHDPYVITMYEMGGAALSIVLFFPIYLISGLSSTGHLELVPTWSDSGYLLILALLCTVYAFSVSVELMKRLTPFTVNLSINLEPVYGIIMALIFFNEMEELSKAFFLGTIIIMSAILIYPLVRYSKNRKSMLSKNETLL